MSKILYTIVFLTIFSIASKAQGSWSSLANFFENRHSPSSFSNGNKVYVGLGFTSTTNSQVPKKDLWSYNVATDAWTQRADLPGDARFASPAVNFNNKGYIMCGRNGTFPNFSTYLNEFWEYDPTLNAWTQKSSLIGVPSGSAGGTAFATTNAIYTITKFPSTVKVMEI